MKRTALAIVGLVLGSVLFCGCGSEDDTTVSAADKGPKVPLDQQGQMGGQGQKPAFEPLPVNPPTTGGG